MPSPKRIPAYQLHKPSCQGLFAPDEIGEPVSDCAWGEPKFHVGRLLKFPLGGRNASFAGRIDDRQSRDCATEIAQ